MIQGALDGDETMELLTGKITRVLPKLQQPTYVHSSTCIHMYIVVHACIHM